MVLNALNGTRTSCYPKFSGSQPPEVNNKIFSSPEKKHGQACSLKQFSKPERTQLLRTEPEIVTGSWYGS